MSAPQNSTDPMSTAPAASSPPISPPPPTSPQFWNRRARNYAKKPVPDEAAYAQTLERIRAHLSPDARVLELGCGTGTTALHLAASAREILGTDYSTEMIAIATEKARVAGVNHVRFLACTLDDPGLPRESFDVVMAMNFLHLLDDIPARFRRIAELIRPGGLFISKTPCLGDHGLHFRLLLPVLRAFGAAPYVNLVTERSLRVGLPNAGFRLEETGMYPVKSRSFFVVARKLA